MSVCTPEGGDDTWVACTCHQTALIQPDDHPDVLLLLNVVQIPKGNIQLLSATVLGLHLQMTSICLLNDSLPGNTQGGQRALHGPERVCHNAGCRTWMLVCWVWLLSITSR